MKKVKNAIREFKTEFDRINIEKLSQCNNSSKDYWHIIKSMNGNKCKSNIPSLVVGESSKLTMQIYHSSLLFPNNHYMYWKLLFSQKMR